MQEHSYQGDGSGPCSICGNALSSHKDHIHIGSAFEADPICQICGQRRSQFEAMQAVASTDPTETNRVKSEFEGKSSSETSRTSSAREVSKRGERKGDHKKPKKSQGSTKYLKRMASGSSDLASMDEKSLAKHFKKSPPLRWDQLSPDVQTQIQKKAGPFAANQTGEERWDAEGNYLGDVFGSRDGKALLHMKDGGPTISINTEHVVDFSKLNQKELNQFSTIAPLLENAGPIHVSGELRNQLVDGSALPAEMIPKGYSETDLIPTEAFRSGTAIPSNALPASVKASALEGSLEINSEALPASVIPKGYSQGDPIPAKAFDKDFAIPSNALPAEALPASALPASVLASALPSYVKIKSGALPASVIPKGYSQGDAIPAEAFDGNFAIPSNALPASAIPSNLLLKSALPASALPASALPASALPASALLASVTPVYALPAEALKGSLKIDSSKLSPNVTIPDGFKRGDLIPAKEFPPGLAIPSNALPASALPASALPASGLPSALPAEMRGRGKK